MLRNVFRGEHKKCFGEIQGPYNKSMLKCDMNAMLLYIYCTVKLVDHVVMMCKKNISIDCI